MEVTTMAYDYDRMDGEEQGGGAFLMGLLAGTVLGAGLGMLFAPKSGSALRTDLADSANRLQRTATDTYNQATERVGHWVERGRDAYSRAREGVTEQAGEFRGTTSGQGTTGQTTGGTTAQPWTNTGTPRPT
jgi:gas vesicle protein